MIKDKSGYRKDVAFIDREKELAFLKDWINERPESLLFLHGPKSSGKTTLLYKFLEQMGKEQELDIKFLNLRKIYTDFSGNYDFKDFLNIFFNVEDKGEKKEKLSAGINVGFFKIDSEIEKKMQQGKVDPFKVMEREFLRLYKKKMRNLIVDYVIRPEQKKIEKLLRRLKERDEFSKEEIDPEDEELLRDMVRQNILYFDPTEATYYPQGKSYHHGIRLYFEKSLERGK